MDRLFVAFTVAEAAALVAQCDLNPIAASLSAVAKIRWAVKGAVSTVKAPAASLIGPPGELRAKNYRPPDGRQRFRQRPPSRPFVPVADPTPTCAAAAPDDPDTYVPWRDEADGRYR